MPGVHGGGVAMCIPQQFNSIFHERYSKLEQFVECVDTKVIMKKKSLFLCVYRPPNADFDEFVSSVTYSITGL